MKADWTRPPHRHLPLPCAHSALLLAAVTALSACGSDKTSPTLQAGTGASGNDLPNGAPIVGGQNGGGTTGTPIAGTVGGGVTVGAPGEVRSSSSGPLPEGLPTACEWEWTVRTIHYNPAATTPRRLYTASCQAGDKAKMFTSLAVGPNVPLPEADPTSGALVVAELDEAKGTLQPTTQQLFKECVSMHGVAVSDDCQTIGVLCRTASGRQGFDKDVFATHPDTEWLSHPGKCGDRLNDEMWLYEWTNGDIQSTPKRYIVHKSIGSWETGNDYLRLSKDGSSWGIGVKATVIAPDTCHEADSFLIMDRKTETFTTRGWGWACGTGHTTMNRIAHDPTTGKFAALCSTDYNDSKKGGLGAFVFRMDDGPHQEFHYLNQDQIWGKGGASSIVPRTGGGFLGLIVGVPGPIQPEKYPDKPPTRIGLVAWSSEGKQQGEIRWILSNPDHYLSYSTLSVLGPNRYLLGWGVMRATNHQGEPGGDNSYRVPWEYWLMEIDGEGHRLTEPQKLDGAGWGELDEMAPLGKGRAGWAYIDNPALDASGAYPSCNQPSLELSVYHPAKP